MPRALPALLVLLSACRTEWAGSWARGGPPPEGAPNVLLVSLDTLRADHLPFYGYVRETAPFLSGVAAEGAVFELSWAQSPATDGSHASLFTGLYQSEHGKFSHRQRLGDRETTIAEHFRAQGYRTFALANSAKFVRESGFDQGFEVYETSRGVRKIDRSARTNARARELMAGDGPWFGFVHYFDAHAPYHAPDPYGGRWVDGDPPIAPEKTTRYIRQHRDRPDLVSVAERDALRALYDGQILYLDGFMEELWSAFPPGRPTIVAIVADHGEAFHEHGYLGHGEMLWEEILRVPMLFWAPGIVEEGLRVRVPSQTVDVFPTLADLAGLPAPPNSGRSFAADLRGEGASADDRGLVLQGTRYWSIVRSGDQGRFKLTIRLADQSERLERLDVDPGGIEDVKERYPAVRESLRAELAAMGFTDPRRRSIERDDISREEMEQLEAIGYVEEE